MSTPDEGSVAPQERVNIVYRPAVAGAQEDVELPLKLLIAGDFTGAADPRPLEQREPVNIDKDTFNDVLQAHQLKLDVTAPNRLSRDPDAELSVHLEFSTMNDFSPEAVAAQIPALKALMEVRNALSALKGPLANVPEFRAKIQRLIKDDATRHQLLAEIGIQEQESLHD